MCSLAIPFEMSEGRVFTWTRAEVTSGVTHNSPPLSIPPSERRGLSDVSLLRNLPLYLGTVGDNKRVP